MCKSVPLFNNLLEGTTGVKMNGKSTWGHGSETKRKDFGLPLEEEFAKKFVCECGGKFRKSKRYWEPDLTCDACGQKVDIKSSPQTARTGNLSVSAKMWHKYDEDVLIVTNVSGTWLGGDKAEIEENCGCIDKPLDSTHAKTGGYDGGAYASSFYLIPVRSLQVLG